MNTDRKEFWGLIGSNLAVVAVVIGLFSWNRAESRSDYRHHDAILVSIQQEMKDFHGRLCAIEEKYRQMEKK